MTHEHWQSVKRGALRAAADLKDQGITVDIIWDGPNTESDATQQINLIDNKIAMGIQGLVLAPLHSGQMVAPVERAVAKGIKVVIIDSGLDPRALKENPNLMVKYVATDNRNGGRLAGEKLIELLRKEKKDEPVKVILFRYAPGSESTMQREEGFLEAVEDANKKAGKEIVKVVSQDKYAGATADEAKREAGPLLSQFPMGTVDGIFAVNESSTFGMLNALREKNRVDEITLVGFDSSEPLVQALREGHVASLVIQDPYRMGYLGVWNVVMALEGYDVSAGGLVQSTGEVFLTRENLDSEEMRGRFQPDAQARRKIETPKYTKK
jgi:ribose transport system substrate-binding protein